MRIYLRPVGTLRIEGIGFIPCSNSFQNRYSSLPSGILITCLRAPFWSSNTPRCVHSAPPNLTLVPDSSLSTNFPCTGHLSSTAFHAGGFDVGFSFGASHTLPGACAWTARLGGFPGCAGVGFISSATLLFSNIARCFCSASHIGVSDLACVSGFPGDHAGCPDAGGVFSDCGEGVFGCVDGISVLARRGIRTVVGVKGTTFGDVLIASLVCDHCSDVFACMSGVGAGFTSSGFVSCGLARRVIRIVSFPFGPIVGRVFCSLAHSVIGVLLRGFPVSSLLARRVTRTVSFLPVGSDFVSIGCPCIFVCASGVRGTSSG